MTLLQKTSYVLLTSALLGVITFSSIAYMYMQWSIEKAITNQQSQITHQTMKQVDRALYNSLLELQSISQEDQLENILNSDSTDQLGMNAVNKRMNELALTSGPWDLLSLVNKNGQITVSTKRSEIGKNITEFEASFLAFSKSIKGEIYYSDLELSARSGKANMIFSVPVHDNSQNSHEIIGVVVAHLSWQTIVEVLGEIQGIKASLYNSSGTLIASNDREDERYFLTAQMVDRIDAPTLEVGPTAVISKVYKDKQTGENMLSTFSKEAGYLGYRGHEWTLIFDLPTRIAYAPARAAALNFSIILALLTTAFALPNLFIVYRSVSKPIMDLTHHVNSIASGRFDERITINSNDEIGQLARAYNSMAEKLESFYAELQQSLHSLEQKNIELDKRIIDEERMNKLMVGRELKMVALKQRLKDLGKPEDIIN